LCVYKFKAQHVFPFWLVKALLRRCLQKVPSKQKIPMSKRQHRHWLTRQQLPVRPYRIGLLVNFHDGLVVVMDHIFLADVSGVFDDADAFTQTQISRHAAFYRRLGQPGRVGNAFLPTALIGKWYMA
jgi:hypothetical protein